MTTTRAEFDVPAPDPKAMYLRVQAGEIAAGPYTGSGFGTTGASLYIDVVKDGVRQGIVVIPATVWVSSIIDALDGAKP